jgi:P4 family phage/plasmid primase-like protien
LIRAGTFFGDQAMSDDSTTQAKLELRRRRLEFLEKEQERKLSKTHRNTNLIKSSKTPQQWAYEFVEDTYRQPDGRSFLRYWRGNYYEYDGNKYKQILIRDIPIGSYIEDHPIRIEDEVIHVPRTRNLVADIVECLKDRRGVRIPDEIEQDSWLIPSDQMQFDPEKFVVIPAEGEFLIINKETKKATTYPSSPDYFSQYCLPFKFDPSAKCPQWDKFVGQISRSDQKDYRFIPRLLQQWAGYLFLPNLSKQKFLVCFGTGNNGKSTFVNVLRELIGRQYCSSCQINDFQEVFKYYSSWGKRANIADENESRINDKCEAILKAYTSGESIQWEAKYQPAFSAKPSAKLIFTTNQCPSFGDMSEGLWRRLTIVPFYYVVPSGAVDRELYLKLCTELPGIFNWALGGLLSILGDSEDFVFPKICKNVLSEIREKVNTVRGFVVSNYVWRDYEADGVPCNKLHGEYVTWCTDPTRDYTPLSPAKFDYAIKALFPWDNHFGKARRICVDGDEQKQQPKFRNVRSYTGLIPIPRTEDEILLDINKQDEYDKTIGLSNGQ